jgi:peptidoglycan/xylan/chitin deacetylase (PgdA/CDA1 family)
MNKSLIQTAAVFCLLSGLFFCACRTGAKENSSNAKTVEPSSKLVVLKLDDVVCGSAGLAVPKLWQRVADYLEEKQIKSSMGIIGFSLVDANPAYYKWITDRATPCGYVEFWHHGFHPRTLADPLGEFMRSYDEQMYSFRMTDSLAYTKMGLQLSVWGPHWSPSNEDTDSILAQMPQIRMTFSYPPNAVHYKGFVFKNRIDIEFPTHNPDFEAFREDYLEKSKHWDYFFLQGHPESWNTKARWENFVKIIEYLENEGVRFVTPTELYVILKGRGEI